MSNLTAYYLIGNATHDWNKRTDCIYGNGLNFTWFDLNQVSTAKKQTNACGIQINSNTTLTAIDHKRVKYISMQTNYTKWNYAKDEEPRVAYIADTKNHCIRKINVDLASVSTIAGICGTPGLVDGLFSVNMLNSPEVVGVDA